MKNLKGALPPQRENQDSSAGYFYTLGIILILIGLILTLGTIFIFITAAGPSEYTYDEGRVYLSPQMFIFLLIMSLVFLVTGLSLLAVSKRLSKFAKPRKKSAPEPKLKHNVSD